MRRTVEVAFGHKAFDEVWEMRVKVNGEVVKAKAHPKAGAHAVEVELPAYAGEGAVPAATVEVTFMGSKHDDQGGDYDPSDYYNSMYS